MPLRLSPISSPNRLPLSDDIIDLILLSSPTFSSLKSTILTCKSFYHVFQTHPTSIVRGVAANIAGPALPQALECIRHPEIAECARGFEPPTHWGEEDEDDGGGSEHSSDDADDSARAERRESVVQEPNNEENNTADLSLAPITPEETHKLLANAQVIARLEDLFSFRQVNFLNSHSYSPVVKLTQPLPTRYIDRSSSTSQLSGTESRDFRVGMYRFMLYSSIFHPGTWNLGSDSEDHNDDNDNNNNDNNNNNNNNNNTANTANTVKTRQILEKRTLFLSRFSTPDLLQLHSVAEFLKEILAWCVRESGYPPEICDIALAAGPTRIIECYTTQTAGLAPLADILDFFEEELEFHPTAAGYLSLPLANTLESRGTTPPPADSTHWCSISGRARESNSQCTRCHNSFGFEVFSRDTFTSLAASTSASPCPRLLLLDPSLNSPYTPQSIPTFLKNHLRHNTPESACLRAEAAKHDRGLLLRIWEDLWTGGLVRQETRNGVGAVPDWKEDDDLCQGCFKSFLIENLWVWLRQVKANSAPLAENCWYGYNCRTQTHNLAHAQKLNHPQLPLEHPQPLIDPIPPLRLIPRAPIRFPEYQPRRDREQKPLRKRVGAGIDRLGFRQRADVLFCGFTEDAGAETDFGAVHHLCEGDAKVAESFVSGGGVVSRLEKTRRSTDSLACLLICALIGFAIVYVVLVKQTGKQETVSDIEPGDIALDQVNVVQVPANNVPFKERVIGVAKKTRGTLLNKVRLNHPS
ncbi:hypothetical protein F5876DRAFT_63805 [Lentinula aff. lateritia]|uniref:Uncharacterized protein n=1 Tax=Lentinula aff. lateritia TaxID=2804960 RepID=A0ACC1U6I5_9AGAR|nr:hypothetical protein F5876DRAFT_63805 [Lentinula aff. lateritia]